MTEKTMTSRRKVKYASVIRQGEQITKLLTELPTEDEVYKLVSCGSISPLGFIRFVAEKVPIDRLTATTFRVGPAAMKELRRLRERGRLEHARFVIGKVQAQDHRKTSAIKNYDALVRLCARYSWELASMHNHTKLFLFDTAAGKFVMECSGNLNEAPNWEFFSLQNDPELYDFYAGVVDEMFATNATPYCPPEEDDVEGDDDPWRDPGNQLAW